MQEMQNIQDDVNATLVADQKKIEKADQNMDQTLADVEGSKK